MADSYIEVEVETDPQTLADNAVDQLAQHWPDWEPNDGDMEVIQIEALAPMAADAAETAAQVPSAVFRTILERLHGIARAAGSPATATVTFHMVDADSHQIDAGFAVDVDGVEFTVDEDQTVAALSTSGVAVTASVDGVIGNDLIGDSVTPITASSFVSDVTLDAVTAGGLDPEDDAAYQDRGSLLLELQAATLVTSRDYELKALGTPGIGRAVAVSDPDARTIDVTVAGDQGEAASTATKNALLADYDALRQATWTVDVHDATYTTVTVTVEVQPYPGYDATDLAARIKSMLDDTLNPATYGSPSGFGDPSSSVWFSDPRVRKNKLIDLIGDVAGVDYVVDLSIAGTAGTVQANGDLLMPGTVALPLPGAHVVTVD